MEQQSEGIEQINIAIEQMNQVTQQTAANSEQSASSAEELSGQSQEMMSLIGSFTIQKKINGEKYRAKNKGRFHQKNSFNGNNLATFQNRNSEKTGKVKISNSAIEAENFIPFDNDENAVLREF